MRITIASIANNGLVTDSHMLSVINAIGKLQKEHGYDTTVNLKSVKNSSPTTMAKLLFDFAQSEDELIILIDGDIAFTEENIRRLVFSGKDIVTAIYPIDSLDWNKMLGLNSVYDLKSAGLQADIVTSENEDSDDGFIEIKRAGKKFLALSKLFVNSVKDILPYKTIGDEKLPMFFMTGVDTDTGETLTESEFLFSIANKHGFKAYADIKSPLAILEAPFFYGA